MANRASCDGVLIANKPRGFMSRAIDDRIKRLVKPLKVGHLGTLDPFAEGVLPILIGKATRLADYIDKNNKRYLSKIFFGASTDTWDITGNINNTCEQSTIDETALKQALSKFTGTIEQVIPPYSAAKRKGKRSYDEARKGNAVEPGNKLVSIEKIELLKIGPGEIGDDKARVKGVEVTLDIVCSRGTYIRSLAVELGKSLGAPTLLASLIRSEAGGFPISIAVDLEKYSDEELKNALCELIIPPRDALAFMPEIQVDISAMKAIKNGTPFQIDVAPGIYKLCFGNELAAIVAKEEKLLLSYKVIFI